MRGDITPHEFLRFPMFYAAAYDVTGEKRYFAEYEKYRDEACEKSVPIRCETLWHLYAALQMQFSVRLPYDFDPDETYHAKYGFLLQKVADDCRAFVLKRAPVLCSGDLSRYNYSYEPWRTLPPKPIPGVNEPNFLKPVRDEENPAFYPLRDFGNAVHALGLCDGAVRDALYSVMDTIDYENHSSGGPLDLLGGYRAVEKALSLTEKNEK